MGSAWFWGRHCPEEVHAHRALSADVADPPDRVRAVVGHQQRAIERGGNAYGTAPYLTVREHESGQEVLVFSASLPGLVQRHADNLVAGANGLVPRAMLGGEDVSFVFIGELRALVEGNLQRGVVWLE